MMDNFYKKFAINIFRKAGVEVNGSKDSDIQVKNEKFYKKVIFGGSLAFGETYMAGFWDCERIDKLVALLLKSKLDNKYKGIFLLGKVFLATFFNQQNLKKAKKNIERHYDIGNDLYSLMLDKRMVYSCGYWQKANNLDEAQEAKLDLICRKLKLKKGMSILDIGCGWGSFAKFVAEKYGCQVTGVTLSAEQARYAQNNCSHLPVKILKDDYRKVKGKFDRVVSIGMFEHVEPKNYKQYFKKVYSLLTEDGISLLHTIGTNKQKQMTEPFIEKYIFPGGVL
ncbi:MAG TPA: methyltransferase domain-containing protein, partial [Candidatus Moranbacteria bacterium]|nr:methyltransferase domain-containing protein [Candidatus Moranbacteria bacterium]